MADFDEPEAKAGLMACRRGEQAPTQACGRAEMRHRPLLLPPSHQASDEPERVTARTEKIKSNMSIDVASCKALPREPG